MPTAVTPTTYTPSTNNSWNLIDASGLLPANAKGAMCYVIGGSGDTEVGVRMEGSATDLRGFLGAGQYTNRVVGLNASRQFRAYKAGAGESPTVVVYGYFDSTEYVPIMDAEVLTLGAAYTFVPLDISAFAIGGDVPLAACGFSMGQNSGLAVRMNGSSDDRINDGIGNFSYGGWLAPLDEDAIFEAATENSGDSIYLDGYIKANFVGHLNAIDRTPGTFVDYVDLSPLTAGAVAAAYEVASNGSSALRPKAGVPDIYAGNGKVQRTHIAFGDASRIVQVRVNASTTTVYEQGYFTAGGGSTSVPLMGRCIYVNP